MPVRVLINDDQGMLVVAAGVRRGSEYAVAAARSGELRRRGGRNCWCRSRNG